jgi:alpha-glucosidase (family GH31 glycosyl hydrolase)
MNGGHGERALWVRSAEELEIIRAFSWLHCELVPYMYSYVVECHNGAPPLQRPAGGTYQFMFGDYLLVAPIYQDTTLRRVILPGGKWRYFFDDKKVIQGPMAISRDYPLDEYPVYVRQGAIIPMNIERGYTGFGDDSFDGFLTLLIYPEKVSQFVVHHPDGSGATEINLEGGEDELLISLKGVKKKHILRIASRSRPAHVHLDGHAQPGAMAWWYDDEAQVLFVKTEQYSRGFYRIVY